MSILELNSLCVFYGEVQVLQNVSLRVHEGEIVSLVGSNASGKTTTINAVCGLLPVSSGEVHFEGLRLDALPFHEIARHGVIQIPEGRRLFPHMTVYENLLMGAYAPRARPSWEQSLQEVYRLFPVLMERREQRAGTLSGGSSRW